MAPYKTQVIEAPDAYMEIPESTGFLHRESLDQLEDEFLSSDWFKTTFLDYLKVAEAVEHDLGRSQREKCSEILTPYWQKYFSQDLA